MGRPMRKTPEPTALEIRAVDALVSKLLSEIRIPDVWPGKRTLKHLTDLRRVLSADYREAAGMPAPEMLKELAERVEKDIRSQRAVWSHWGDPKAFARLSRSVCPDDLTVRAAPYRKGAGLSLRGFFCRAGLGHNAKFVVFLNTAHHPGAVAATFGHELGHYIHGSMTGETREMTVFMEGTLSDHLADEGELFADSLVAFAAYDRNMIRRIGSLERVIGRNGGPMLKRIKRGYELTGSRYGLDLSAGRLALGLRVRYLASLTHFLKLRRALYERTGL